MGSRVDGQAVFDPTPLFSQRVAKWEPGAIRSLLPLEQLPGMISLVAGKPNPETFPFNEISLSFKDANMKKIVLRGSHLDEALQYSLPTGVLPLVQWFERLQSEIHGTSDTDEWCCCVGQGSQELLHRTFQVFTDPGDPVLIETPAYPGVTAFLRAEGDELVEIRSDELGLDSDDLERTLHEWPKYRRRPKVLYTIPTGSNPTGRSCTEARKSKILRLAKKFNFIIFEDDAYYFLNFEDDASKRARSYLGLERDVNAETGRVLRFDSLSKIISSGMRVAFLTGPASAVAEVVKITENINLQPSTTTQALVLSLFRSWGTAGFLEHCHRAAEFYRHRRDVFAQATERHLQWRADWTVPTAGMFFWITLRLPPGMDTFQLLGTNGTKAGVLAIPGQAFMPRVRKTCQLRASYSLVTDEQMDEACRRLAQLVDDAWFAFVREWSPCSH